MPEGDTIHKIARYLASRLTGRRVLRLRVANAPARDCLANRKIRSVFAHGKHLFIELDNAWFLRSHLGMYGTWHRYREGETWRKPRCQASLELLTDDDVFVCFNAKEVELVATASVRERILKTRLGPDLIDAETNPRIVVRRARALLSAETPMVDVLLDQRVAAGIGNVYKSEVLFIRQCPPLRSLESINDTALEACYATAADLLRRNLGGGRRITRFERDDAGRLWVYGRGNLPCLRCGTRISYARLGKDLRGTYWCAGCQT